MTKQEKLELLEETFELEEGELKEDMNLSEIESWDSMTRLSLIVLMDDEFDKKLTGDQIKKFVTVKDILDFME
ncbi:MAG: phosphopantetheine-binding protein [Candidatus Woesearchaeota archaeon]|jgi:acyl carrier protein